MNYDMRTAHHVRHSPSGKQATRIMNYASTPISNSVRALPFALMLAFVLTIPLLASAVASYAAPTSHSGAGTRASARMSQNSPYSLLPVPAPTSAIAVAQSQTATVAPSDTTPATDLPGAVQSPGAPAAPQTAQAIPNAQGTPGTVPATTEGSFPWLPVVVVGLAALAVAGFVLMRPRRVVSVAGDAPPTATVAPTPDQANTASAATEGAAVTAAAQSTLLSPNITEITCPNCEATNSVREDFCRECGQDLRPTRAALLAPVAAPPDLVTDDMPYLETLDRTDEQLEYVLSRPRVVIGTASSSDIVIDSAFAGWQSVSPTHAELRREADGYLVVDKGSQAGTFVNNMRTGENILADGDTLRFGDVRFIFHVPSTDNS